MSEIKVLVWGLGAMGSGMVSMLAKKEGVRIVGGLARTPAKVGKDLGEIAGCEPVGVSATNDVEEAFKAKPDIVLLNTASFVREVLPEIETCLSRGTDVITIAEEMAYPWATSPDLADRIDALARKAGKTVLGTGINPGFVLDTLIITLTGVARDVKHIHARRINNLAPFGPTVMRTQGVGTTVAEFKRGLRENAIVGHVGFPQSCHLIGRALGWKIDRVVEEREPIVSKVERKTRYVTVRPGEVAGCRHTARAYSGGSEVIFLEHPQQVCPELEGVETGDYIDIDGDPPISLAVRPEIPGGAGTIAIAVNMIPAVVRAPAGLLTMADLPVPRAVLGSFSQGNEGGSGRKPFSMDRATTGDWVEVHTVFLKPGERSPDVPPDTATVPLEGWVRGWALGEACIGERITIRTPAGRVVEGTLRAVNPGYTHSFGSSVPELRNIGRELRRLLGEGKSDG